MSKKDELANLISKAKFEFDREKRDVRKFKRRI